MGVFGARKNLCSPKLVGFISLCLLSLNTIAGHDEQLVKDIQNFHKDHVKRFENVTTLSFSYFIHKSENLYSEDPLPRKIDQEAIRLLLGYYGINQKTKKNDRYDNQVKWALEYLIRRTTRGDILKAFQDIITDMATEGKSFNLQHISWVVFFALNATFDIDQTFQRNPNIKTTRAIFLKDKNNYKTLGVWAEDIWNYINVHRAKDLDNVDEQLKKVHYEQTRNDIFRFLKVKPNVVGKDNNGLSSPINFNPVDLKIGIKKDVALQFNVGLKGPFLKNFKVKLTGSLQNVSGDGSCFYHAVRDQVNPIDWKSGTDINQILSRTFLQDQILSRINEPVIRHYLSQAIAFYFIYFDLWQPTNTELPANLWKKPEECARKIYEISKKNNGQFFKQFFDDKMTNHYSLSEYAPTQAFELLAAYINDYDEIYLLEEDGQQVSLTMANRLFPSKTPGKPKTMTFFGAPGHYLYIRDAKVEPTEVN